MHTEGTYGAFKALIFREILSKKLDTRRRRRGVEREIVTRRGSTRSETSDEDPTIACCNFRVNML